METGYKGTNRLVVGILAVVSVIVTAPREIEESITSTI